MATSISGSLTTDNISRLDAIDNANKTSTLAKNQKLDKDAFLKILTTQLQYQDPLNPVSDKDFIGQMAQFSNLEQTYKLAETMTKSADNSDVMTSQLTKLNENIEKMMTGQDTGTTTIDKLMQTSETNNQIQVQILNELIKLNSMLSAYDVISSDNTNVSDAETAETAVENTETNTETI